MVYGGNGGVTPLVLLGLRVNGGSTQLLGVPNAGGGSTTVIVSGGRTVTTTAGASEVTVTRVPDKDTDTIPSDVDFEQFINGTFSIHTTRVTGSVTLVSLATQSSPDNPNLAGGNIQPNNDGPSSNGVPLAAVISIVLGLLLVIACLVAFLFYKRSKRQSMAGLYTNIEKRSPLIPTPAASIDTSRHSPLSPTEASLGHPQTPSLGPSASLFSGLSSDPTITTLDNQSGNSAQSSLEPVRKQRVPATPAPPVTPFNQPNRKEREARESELASGEMTPPQTPVLVHEDSGLRIRPPPLSSLPPCPPSEVPPMYTPI